MITFPEIMETVLITAFILKVTHCERHADMSLRSFFFKDLLPCSGSIVWSADGLWLSAHSGSTSAAFLPLPGPTNANCGRDAIMGEGGGQAHPDLHSGSTATCPIICFWRIQLQHKLTLSTNITISGLSEQLSKFG